MNSPVVSFKFDGTFSINFLGEDISTNYRDIFEYDLTSAIKGIKKITNFQQKIVFPFFFFFLI